MKKIKARGGYTHRDKNFWADLISGQASSGQDVKGYCRSRGVSASSFYRWQNLLASDCGAGPGFHAIEIAPGPPCGVIVELPGGINVRFIDRPPVEYLHRLSGCFQRQGGC